MMADTKMRPVTWHERSRANRLASVMYPGLADPEARRDMDYFAKQEGKRSPLSRSGSKSEQPKQRR
jgi:hypothetical protein